MRFSESLTSDVQVEDNETQRCQTFSRCTYLKPSRYNLWQLTCRAAAITSHYMDNRLEWGWSSTLEMLGRLLEQQAAISAALLSPEVRRSDLYTLTEADGEHTTKALKPLQAASCFALQHLNMNSEHFLPVATEICQLLWFEFDIIL